MLIAPSQVTSSMKSFGTGWVSLNVLPVNDPEFEVFAGLFFAVIGGFVAASKYSGRVRHDL